MTDLEIQKPREMPRAELSLEGLQAVVGQGVEMVLESRRIYATAEDKTITQGLNERRGAIFIESDKVYENARRIADILDQILPLSEGLSWNDEIEARADTAEQEQEDVVRASAI